MNIFYVIAIILFITGNILPAIILALVAYGFGD